MAQQTDATINLIRDDILTAIQSIAKTDGYAVSDVHPIENDKLDFDEGGSELTATISRGVYTGSALASQIQTGMNNVATATITVSYGSDRKFTISTDGATLNIRTGTGTNSGDSIGTLIGMASDQTGSTSYTGSATSGYWYDIGETGKNLKGFDECYQYPAAFVTSSAFRNLRAFHDQPEIETGEAEFIIDAYVKGYETDEPGQEKDTNLNRLMSDIVRAVLEDRTRGGYAQDTYLSEGATDMGIVADYGLLSLVFIVQYDFDMLYP